MAKFHVICSEVCCGKLARTRGLCIAHYRRWQRYGDASCGGVSRGALMNWLNANAGYAGDECLFWPFGKKEDGRGCVRFRGRTYVASRVMCTIAHGEPRDQSMEAAHSCGNGHLSCCNPRHLRWATKAENMADAIAHGTTSRGSRHGASKLSAEDVERIKNSTETGVNLARSFGVSTSTICGIRRERKWKWLAS